MILMLAHRVHNVEQRVSAARIQDLEERLVAAEKSIAVQQGTDSTSQAPDADSASRDLDADSASQAPE